MERAPVAAQSLATFPVFGGISGSQSATCSMWMSLKLHRFFRAPVVSTLPAREFKNHPKSAKRVRLARLTNDNRAVRGAGLGVLRMAEKNSTSLQSNWRFDAVAITLLLTGSLLAVAVGSSHIVSRTTNIFGVWGERAAMLLLRSRSAGQPSSVCSSVGSHSLA